MTEDEGDKNPTGAEQGTHAADAAKTKTSRRRFGRAGLAAPIIMTLASRPVWATGRQCSVSALASFDANGSHPVDMNTCKACSPGYWHISQACWPSGWGRTERFGDKFDYDINHYEQRIDDPVAPGQPSYQDIVDVLELRLEQFFPTLPPPSPVFKACRAALSAMLNASHPNVPYWYDASEILGDLYNVFPRIPPLHPKKPTLGNDALQNVADKYANSWDDEDIDCILPGNGNCP